MKMTQLEYMQEVYGSDYLTRNYSSFEVVDIVTYYNLTIHCMEQSLNYEYPRTEISNKEWIDYAVDYRNWLHSDFDNEEDKRLLMPHWPDRLKL